VNNISSFQTFQSVLLLRDTMLVLLLQVKVVRRWLNLGPHR